MHTDLAQASSTRLKWTAVACRQSKMVGDETRTKKVFRKTDIAHVLWAGVELYVWKPEFNIFLRHLDHNCHAGAGKEAQFHAAKRPSSSRN